MTAPSTLRVLPAALVAFVLPFGSSEAQGSDVLAAQANLLYGLSESQVEVLNFQGTVGSDLDVALRIDGEPLILDLAPRSVRAPGFQLLEQQDDGAFVQVDPGPVRTLSGNVFGRPNARVSASWLDDGLHARVDLGGEQFWIQPLAGQVAGAESGHHVIYRGSDVLDGNYTCATDASAVNPNEFLVDDTLEGGLGNWVAELACDADFQFYQSWGSSTVTTSNRVQNLINIVNQQYETEVTITHQITTILVRASSGQNPYTTSDAGGLLNQFANQWNQFHGGIQRDLAHLFTGRNLSGSTLGIATLGTICNVGSAYGLAQSNLGNLACSTDVTSHEMGHNWGSGHCNCPNNTMNAGLTCTNTFNANATRPVLRAARNSAGCIERECDTLAAANLRTVPSNVGGFTVTQPRLGQTWTATVDLTVTGYFSGSVIAFKNPAAIDLGARGFLLVNPSTPEFLGLDYLSGNQAQFNLDIPIDPNLCGFTFSCQGVHYIDPAFNFVIRLTNAFDCVIGS